MAQPALTKRKPSREPNDSLALFIKYPPRIIYQIKRTAMPPTIHPQLCAAHALRFFRRSIIHYNIFVHKSQAKSVVNHTNRPYIPNTIHHDRFLASTLKQRAYCRRILCTLTAPLEQKKLPAQICAGRGEPECLCHLHLRQCGIRYYKSALFRLRFARQYSPAAYAAVFSVNIFTKQYRRSSVRISPRKRYWRRSCHRHLSNPTMYPQYQHRL